MKKPAPIPSATATPFGDVRRASVPLVMYETSDPAQTIRNALAALNGSGQATPVLQYDLSRFVSGVNQPGLDLVNLLNPNPLEIANPSEFLKWLGDPDRMKELKTVRNTTGKIERMGAIVFIHNAHKLLPDATVMQATWNLRDPFKQQGITLVLLTIPGATIPPELANDVVTLTDPKPGPKEASAIIKRIAEAAQAGGADIDPDKVSTDERTIDRSLGTSGFGVEQVVAMSIRKTGLDVATLTARQRKMIEQTPGLSVWRGGETFDQLGGLENLKRFLTLVLTSGNTPVSGILYADEIEKSLAGSAGDTSGTSQDQLGVILRCMEDWKLPGIILVGPPGTGKSAISKAAGRIADVPVIALDLGAMKGSLVGESEAKIRAGMDVFKAICQGKGIVIATCNKIASLPPELRRRFTLGTFFVNLPTANERTAIWQFWRKEYSIPEDDINPPSEQWSGAECKTCCDVAFRTGMTLLEASKFIVPVCKSAADQIEALQKMAHGRFISASTPGIYSMEQKQTEQPASRAMQF